MTEVGSKDRMIAAAASLFSQAGFHGITTRDIAERANVSESLIFRYFPTKRDLFVTAIDTELGKLSVQAGLLAELSDADDPRAALEAIFESITEIVVKQPELVRLLHYSALEFGNELEPMYRRHLDGVLAASTGSFQSWARRFGFRALEPQVAVLSFVATITTMQLYPLVMGSALPFPSVNSAAGVIAKLWCRVLEDGALEDAPQVALQDSTEG